MERKFEGIWIPKKLWFSTELKPLEKFILLEIHSLDKTDQHCFASNEHFTELFGIGAATVSRVVKRLSDKNIIKTTIITTKNGSKRVIESNLTSWLDTFDIDNTRSSKRLDPSNQNDRHNSINTNSNTKVLQETSSEASDVTDGVFSFGDDPEIEDDFFLWIKNITEEAKEKSLSEKATQPFNIPRNNTAKYISKIKKYLFELQNGTFLTQHKFSDTFLQHCDQNAVEKLHGQTESGIRFAVEVAIDNYLTARNNPDEYGFIGRDRKIDLGTFFYEFNENTDVLGISHFLIYYTGIPNKKDDITSREEKLQKIYKKDLQKMYGVVYNYYRDFDDTEKLRMVKSLLSLCRWWKRNTPKLKSVYKGKFQITFPKGMETFIEHYLSRFISDNKFEHAIGLFPEKKYWGQFCDWIYEQKGIDLEVEAEIPSEKKEGTGSSVSLEEIERRMEED